VLCRPPLHIFVKPADATVRVMCHSSCMGSNRA
jgi:hypothetical protein